MRPFVAADLDALALLYADPHVMRWIGAGGVRDRDQARDGLAEMMNVDRQWGFGPWATLDRVSGRLVCETGLCPLESMGPEIELMHLFAYDVWGRGLATEAGTAWLHAAFGVLGLNSVVALAHPDNEASQRVMAKLGMRPDGRGHHYGADLLRYRKDGRVP
jgi:RimJ/RimL family protein N-acetyltransferase